MGDFVLKQTEAGPKIEIPDRFNVTSYVLDRQVSQGRGNNTAIYFKDKIVTYKALQAMSNKAGNCLNKLGLEIENRVVILMEDSPNWVASFFGAIKIGAVPVPLNTMLRPDEYEYLLNDCRAKMIIVGDNLADNIRKIRSGLKHLKKVVVVGEAQGDEDSFEQLMKEASADLEPADTTKNDMAVMFYTSGSTGRPKGVVHLQHDMVICPHLYFISVLGMTENDIVLSVAKLFFAYGVNNMLATFMAGASKIIDPRRPLPENICEGVTKYKATFLFAIPTFYVNILKMDNADQYSLSSLRICVTGGEPLSLDVFNSFKDRFGIELIDCIGMTENLGAYIGTKPGRAKPPSTGELIPGNEVKIVDDDGREVPKGTEGELWVKNDATTPGYWNRHEETKKTIIGEWLRTGDVYCEDESGYFYFRGRVDDVIRTGGLKVIPTDVEGALKRHPAVGDAAVVGAPDEYGLTKPKAFVILNKGYGPSENLVKELQDFVKKSILPHNYPRWIEFMDDLPRGATGKIQRFKLRNK